MSKGRRIRNNRNNPNPNPNTSQMKEDLNQMVKQAHYKVMEGFLLNPDGSPRIDQPEFLEAFILSKELEHFIVQSEDDIDRPGGPSDPGTIQILTFCSIDRRDIVNKWVAGMTKVLEPQIDAHPHFKFVYGFATQNIKDPSDPILCIRLVFPFNNRGIHTMWNHINKMKSDGVSPQFV